MAEFTQIEAPTETITEEATQSPGQQRLHLKLKKPKNDKKVQWNQETVDNEHMGKKKSKCCCIYHKPRMFGESSSSESDSDDDCCHNSYCSGRKKGGHPNSKDPAGDPGSHPGPSDQ
ncbi:E3 ubiquitin-protein ligase PPP1R11 isoform X2 [Nematostella vectensis]|nr:E3 ubiquitin-protein ligase PPP1R11 isoform X2 [Nematostella vectensis]